MHVWAASSEFNQAQLGRNLQQNTQQMTQKKQPQSHHCWTDLEFLGEFFGYLQRNLQLQTRCVERRSQPSFHTKGAVLHPFVHLGSYLQTTYCFRSCYRSQSTDRGSSLQGPLLGIDTGEETNFYNIFTSFETQAKKSIIVKY